MKTATLITLFLISGIYLHAEVLTVSNHPLGGAQYSTLESAYNAASNNDTLLIEGTDILYLSPGGVVLSKQLTYIGAGFNPDKENSKRTLFGWSPGVSYETAIGQGASGSRFYGIVFNYGVRFFPGPSYSNITFENCLFEDSPDGVNLDGHTFTNLVFRNCIFNKDNSVNVRIPGSSTTNVAFQNCIFDGYIDGFNNNFITAIIDHCIFLRNNGEVLLNLKNASVTNSIFMNQSSIANSGTTGGTFFNNIERLGAALPPTGNSGSANLTSTDPLFVSFTLGGLYSPTHDYDVQSGSPAIGAGNDATDIGVHGGVTNFSETGEPLNAPVMRSVQIINTTVAPNGTLNVNVESSKPNDD